VVRAEGVEGDDEQVARGLGGAEPAHPARARRDRPGAENDGDSRSEDSESSHRGIVLAAPWSRKPRSRTWPPAALADHPALRAAFA
jgi:hypothetical protein